MNEGGRKFRRVDHPGLGFPSFIASVDGKTPAADGYKTGGIHQRRAILRKKKDEPEKD